MEYRVLARKYRPANFDDLIGQEVLVRTLSNAIASGRIAHGFLLTGIRGIGKTTTARIIARALNCVGPDGQGGPTIKPCGLCSNCTMIAQDRHVDVLEMDAASHTGVGDIRELIDTVRYLPSSARYKIYIIDEVHMLSNNAFNALLKTLEEPPAHVKFIFATTEARKIPVTILSRCQRFDLKRIDTEMLAGHLANIAAKEEVSIEEEALKLIAIAAEGSVRDSLSLLDQAIARGMDEQGITVTGEAVRTMLGGTDNATAFAMLERLLGGDVAGALEQLQLQYTSGADPLLLVQDYLELTHLVTRVKVSPGAAGDVTLAPNDRIKAKELANKLSMSVLARLWQMWLKGLSEVRMAPSPIAALEMLLIRIAYAAELPTPAEVIRSGANDAPPAAQPSARPVEASTPAAAKPVLELVADKPTASPQNFDALVQIFADRREALLYSQLKQNIRLVSFAPGELVISEKSDIARDTPARIAQCLTQWTGEAWKVTLSSEAGASPLHEQEKERKEQAIQQAAQHPLVSSVLEQFPGAKLVGLKQE